MARIQKDIDVANCERAIRTAFAAPADWPHANSSTPSSMHSALVDTSQCSWTLVDARHRNGVDSYLDALDAQRMFCAAPQKFIVLRLTEISNRVMF